MSSSDVSGEGSSSWFPALPFLLVRGCLLLLAPETDDAVLSVLFRLVVERPLSCAVFSLLSWVSPRHLGQYQGSSSASRLFLLVPSGTHHGWYTSGHPSQQTTSPTSRQRLQWKRLPSSPMKLLAIGGFVKISVVVSSMMPVRGERPLPLPRPPEHVIEKATERYKLGW